MIISIKHLKKILKKYGDKIDIRFFKDINVKGKKYLSDDIVLKEHASIFEKNDIKGIEILYNYNLYEYLSKEFPLEFREPYNVVDFVNLDRILENFNNINAATPRKRFIYMLGDIYGRDTKDGKRNIILGHNEAVTYQKWNDVKRLINKNAKFLFRNSEMAIIIFVDLKEKNNSTYVERFKKNTDLISILVSEKKNHKFKLAPGFVPTEDVFSVTDPGSLLNEYKQSNARLIIIGDHLNDDYKRALFQVKEYDKYVRMMVVPSIDQSNLNHFIRQLQLVYKTDKWN